MAVVTEFTIPARDFWLERTFEAVPDLTLEVERLATHSREWIMPFLWVTHPDVEAVYEAFRTDPSVEDVRLLDVTEDVGHFNVHWSEEVQRLVDQIVDRHGIMQEVEAARGTWFFKLQFVDQDSIEAFQSHFHGRGYSFELQRMHTGTAPKERQFDLTPAQREALVTALELGYFDVPRERTIDGLAAELDVSTNAVSERLRRGTANLVANALTIDAPVE